MNPYAIKRALLRPAWHLAALARRWPLRHVRAAARAWPGSGHRLCTAVRDAGRNGVPRLYIYRAVIRHAPDDPATKEHAVKTAQRALNSACNHPEATP